MTSDGGLNNTGASEKKGENWDINWVNQDITQSVTALNNLEIIDSFDVVTATNRVNAAAVEHVL